MQERSTGCNPSGSDSGAASPVESSSSRAPGDAATPATSETETAALTRASLPTASAGDEVVKLFVVTENPYQKGAATALEYTLNFTAMTLSCTRLMRDAQFAPQHTVVEACHVRRYGDGRWFVSPQLGCDEFAELAPLDYYEKPTPLVVALEEAWVSRVERIILSK